LYILYSEHYNAITAIQTNKTKLLINYYYNIKHQPLHQEHTIELPDDGPIGVDVYGTRDCYQAVHTPPATATPEPHPRNDTINQCPRQPSFHTEHHLRKLYLHTKKMPVD
jgi:hypothetical protein